MLGVNPLLDLFYLPRVLAAETPSQQERLQAIAVSYSRSQGWGGHGGEIGEGPRVSGAPHTQLGAQGLRSQVQCGTLQSLLSSPHKIKTLSAP